jgi:hypothetical protein
MDAWLDHVGRTSGAPGVTFDGGNDQSRVVHDRGGKVLLWLTVDPGLIAFLFLYTRQMNDRQ